MPFNDVLLLFSVTLSLLIILFLDVLFFSGLNLIVFRHNVNGFSSGLHIKSPIVTAVVPSIFWIVDQGLRYIFFVPIGDFSHHMSFIFSVDFTAQQLNLCRTIVFTLKPDF